MLEEEEVKERRRRGKYVLVWQQQANAKIIRK